MKRGLLLAFCMLMLLSLEAQIIFVKAGANGDGTSWKNALGSLSVALKQASSEVEIWVAKGCYLPTDNNKRGASFEILKGAKVYGGFAGTESRRQQRNPQMNLTKLSGEIGTASENDNSYHVVRFQAADTHTILDGFTITAGAANGTSESDRRGGGIYIDAQGGFSQPIIRNCTFKNNRAREGGAIYNNSNQGICNPIINNCHFINNQADLDGGAIFNDGRKNGVSNPIVTNCIFENNIANYGGAMCNYGAAGESLPNLDNCTFSNNRAFMKGGAIYNVAVEGAANTILNDCKFLENIAIEGNNNYQLSYQKNPSKGRATVINLKTKSI